LKRIILMQAQENTLLKARIDVLERELARYTTKLLESALSNPGKDTPVVHSSSGTRNQISGGALQGSLAGQIPKDAQGGA